MLSKCSDLRKQKADLEAEYQRVKAENLRKLLKAGRHKGIPDDPVVDDPLLRAQLEEYTKKLDEAKVARERDPRFQCIHEKQQYISEAIQDFVECQKSIDAITSIIQYAPLTELDFDVIRSTTSLDSPLGRTLLEFLDAVQQILVKRLTEIGPG
jgi:hypothetical protein